MHTSVKDMLKVNEIDVFYAELQAIWKASFRVEKGETVVIVGSNGAGKSTILRTISGVLRPASGSIEFLGRQMEKFTPHKMVELGLSHVPEGRELFPHMTVRENLRLGAYTKEANEKFNDTVEEVYRIFPILKERTKQKASTLSGGEQQMLAIARALMSRPKLLMLDEPSLGLAPRVVLTVFEIIKKLQDMGTSILLVEQNVYHALGIADRGYVLENGRITLDGKGKELLDDEYLKKAYLGLV
jgi:branched-chain amino acid transport system ATP-binding protein